MGSNQPPPPPPPGGPDAGAPVTPAGLGLRFVARLLDALLIGLIVSVLLAVLGLPPPTMALGGIDAWLQSAFTSLLWWGYYVVFESQTGTTLGKRIVSLRVAAEGGGNPTVGSAALRNVWLLFGLIPIVGGLVQLIAIIVIAATIASGDHHRGKHDEIAATAVMR